MRYLIMGLLLIGCSFGSTPKFKVNDCIAYVYKNEFYTNVYYNKIEKVGKEHYKYYGYQNTELIHFADKYSIKVNNKHCEGMGN